MPTDFELTFDQRPGYLYAYIKAATIDERISENYLREMAAKCNELSISRLLIYRDIPAALSTTGGYFAANRLLKLLPQVKIAFVNPYSSNDKPLHFAATVASNFGEQHEVFNDVNKAERWLLS